MFSKYDIIVVGAGHAGCEAAAICSKMKRKTLLITMNMQVIGQMSCNPAMGGVAKGQIVKEIDSLGGMSGIISDKSMIQFRMLNRSKGPAMWSPRTQNDRMLFSSLWRQHLENEEYLDIYQDMVFGLIIKENTIIGVKTSVGGEIFADKIILTNGTFLNGIIHIGNNKFGGGRIAENNATGITEDLIKLGFESGRMKTGTPPRVDIRTINTSILEIQEGDSDIEGFSFMDIPKPTSQRCCWIAYTNKKVHNTLEEDFINSPLFNGIIKGVGPRYCPSIEDKIVRFNDKDRHQLFIEPEGWNTNEIYINGFSSSLSFETQYKALRLIEGFENVKMYRPGYAIEYDFFQPTQLYNTLETKKINNLYFAGQINGTTGYEEAAAQGLLAGINACLSLENKDPLVLTRDQSYIGVLIDDLINKGTDEPYRMFTSRAEYRILLRGENADIRLTPIAEKIGTSSELRTSKMLKRKENISKILELTNSIKVKPDDINKYLEQINSSPIKQQVPLSNLLMRVELNFDNLSNIDYIKKELSRFDKNDLKSAEIECKYKGYIQKEKETAKKSISLESLKIPQNFNYQNIKSLSKEAIQKLEKIQPNTIGQASRISGINPSDIAILLVYIGR